MAQIAPGRRLAHRLHIDGAMGAFEDLLKRQGYVKLDQYGLVLTPDDRILSTRPAVLDDGLGGKIVGWADGDLAAAELERWGAAAKPAAAKRVAANPGLRSPPPALPATRAPRGTLPPVAVAAPIPAPVTKPAVVAAEPVVEEDEWEWEIAMARARAAADDVQTAAAAMSFTAPAPKKQAIMAPKKTMQMGAVAPLAHGSGPINAATASLAAASAAVPAKADPMSSWPTTETLQPAWNDATRESPAPVVMSPAAKTLAVVKSTVRAMTPPSGSAQPRSTVIPVPSLPVAAKGSDVRPAFNPGAPPPRLASVAARSRMARGTEPTKRGMAPIAPISEDTVVTAVAANDDQTSPYVLLPPEVKSTGFAHTTRVAAKYR